MNLAKLFLVKKTQRGRDGGVSFSSAVAHRTVLKCSVRSPLSENVKKPMELSRKRSNPFELASQRFEAWFKMSPS